MRLAQWHWVDDEVISPGNAYPQVSRNLPVDGSYNTWLAILDGLDHQPYSRLLHSVCNIVARRHELEQTLVARSPCRTRDSSLGICAMLISRLTAGTMSLEKGTALSIWLKKLFAQQWDAEPLIRDLTCYGTLELLRALYNKMITIPNYRMRTFVVRFITSRSSVVDISKAWVAQTEVQAIHLLHYRFLFSTDQLYLIFRTINHLLMRCARVV